MPAPPADLLARSTGASDLEWFRASGRRSVEEIERTLALAGRTLDSFESILDFGCGCGRILLWLGEIGRRAALHGTDVDAEAIAWARDNVAHASFSVAAAEPPLPYADGSFDLVINHSVFTHLDAPRQDAWLAELARITRPGAMLVLSVHGEWAFGEGSAQARQQLEAAGHLFVPEQRAAGDHPDWYATAYHAPWYVFEHWQRWFALRAYVPRAALALQDHVLLERAEPPLPLRARPHRPGPVEERVRAAQAAIGEAPSRFGRPGALLRGAVLRALRPYTAHQAAVDLELARAIDALAAGGDEAGAER